MRVRSRFLLPVSRSLIAAVLAGWIAMVVIYAPVDPVMGMCQKITYVHVPSAVCAFLACAAVFVSSACYLWQRRPVFDDMAEAAGQVSVVFCSVVLVTGMVWAKDVWGQWWMWTPRLTFSLVMWLLFAAYVALRSAIASPQRRAMACAVYGIIAFLDVPLVYLSTQLMPDVHPESIQMDGRMRYTLLVSVLAMLLLGGAMVQYRFEINIRSRRVNGGRHDHDHDHVPTFGGQGTPISGMRA
ncbi:MAG: hypothetical protein AMXMBFR58_25100 [Phycisphaerae bacterium]|nr:Cytochrome c biogenesis protein CcsA [Phycisphaerales bacterium]MCK6477497.1 cytochrome c biogenesis protein [Phycisphaerales bacterium]